MRRRTAMPSLAVLHEWFYEEPSGVLRWKKDYFSDPRGNGTASSFLVGKAGDAAGYANKGRVQISLHGHTYFRSRLIYKMHMQAEPSGVVDHINQNTLDDRFENLSDVPNSVNVRNSRGRSGDYFLVASRTHYDGRTVKTVRLSWQCQPDEDAEAIAAHLNTLTANYLNSLHAERLRHSPLPEPPKPKPPAGEVNEERLEKLLGLVRRSTTEKPDDEQESGAKVIRIARS